MSSELGPPTLWLPDPITWQVSKKGDMQKGLRCEVALLYNSLLWDNFNLILRVEPHDLVVVHQAPSLESFTASAPVLRTKLLILRTKLLALEPLVDKPYLDSTVYFFGSKWMAACFFAHFPYQGHLESLAPLFSRTYPLPESDKELISLSLPHPTTSIAKYFHGMLSTCVFSQNSNSGYNKILLFCIV